MTPREKTLLDFNNFFVLKFKVEMWQGLESSFPEIK